MSAFFFLFNNFLILSGNFFWYRPTIAGTNIHAHAEEKRLVYRNKKSLRPHKMNYLFPVSFAPHLIQASSNLFSSTVAQKNKRLPPQIFVSKAVLISSDHVASPHMTLSVPMINLASFGKTSFGVDSLASPSLILATPVVPIFFFKRLDRQTNTHAQLYYRQGLIKYHFAVGNS